MRLAQVLLRTFTMDRSSRSMRNLMIALTALASVIFVAASAAHGF